MGDPPAQVEGESVCGQGPVMPTTVLKTTQSQSLACNAEYGSAIILLLCGGITMAMCPLYHCSNKLHHATTILILLG